jgi:hypothetical protein
LWSIEDRTGCHQRIGGCQLGMPFLGEVFFHDLSRDTLDCAITAVDG